MMTPLTGGLVDDLRGEGVKGHLIVGVELIEPVRADGGSGGLPIHDVGAAVELDNAVEMTAQHVRLLVGGVDFEGHLEGQFDRGLTIGENDRLRGVVLEVFDVPNHRADQCLAGFAVVVVVPRAFWSPTSS